jgi:predicted GNAT family acetyltransferase
MFEAHTEAAISTIATQARACPDVRLVLGEKEKIASFWNYFDQGERSAVREDYDLLAIDRAHCQQQCEPVNLRLARPDDLDLIFNAHIQSKLEDTGVSIVKGRLSSIVERCATRIERCRTWVMIDDHEVVFKADIIAHSREAAYLEGIWVHPGWRSKGIGFRCTSYLTRSLLENTSTVCLLVNRQNKLASALYKKIGFKMVSPYQAIFL